MHEELGKKVIIVEAGLLILALIIGTADSFTGNKVFFYLANTLLLIMFVIMIMQSIYNKKRSA